MKMVIAGASGYMGHALVTRAVTEGHDVLILVRQWDDALARYVAQSSYEGPLPAAYVNADALINLAGRAHVRNASADFDSANRRLPLTLAQHVMGGDIGRLVHVSSLGVYGNWSSSPVSERTRPTPETPYARSKLDGDQALEVFFKPRPSALTIVRPPMVFGPACPGNFARLSRFILKGMPLPFGATHAKRSFIFVENLVDFLIQCSDISKPAGLYVIGDGSDYSVSELVGAIARVSGVQPVNFPFPPAIIRTIARVVGMRRDGDSLTRPMVVDWDRARASMQWHPPVPPEVAMRRSLIE